MNSKKLMMEVMVQGAILRTVIAQLVEDEVLDRDKLIQSLLLSVGGLPDKMPTEAGEITAMELRDHLLEWLRMPPADWPQ